MLHVSLYRFVFGKGRESDNYVWVWVQAQNKVVKEFGF